MRIRKKKPKPQTARLQRASRASPGPAASRPATCRLHHSAPAVPPSLRGPCLRDKATWWAHPFFARQSCHLRHDVPQVSCSLSSSRPSRELVTRSLKCGHGASDLHGALNGTVLPNQPMSGSKGPSAPNESEGSGHRRVSSHWVLARWSCHLNPTLQHPELFVTAFSVCNLLPSPLLPQIPWDVQSQPLFLSRTARQNHRTQDAGLAGAP